LDRLWVTIMKANPSRFAHLLAVTEAALALCLILGVFVDLACIGGSVLAVLVWTTAEGFGGPYKAGSTNVGTAIIDVLVFAGPFMSGAGRHLSLGRWLRNRQA
jgi:nitrite reductase (NO-forming)